MDNGFYVGLVRDLGKALHERVTIVTEDKLRLTMQELGPEAATSVALAGATASVTALVSCLRIEKEVREERVESGEDDLLFCCLMLGHLTREDPLTSALRDFSAARGRDYRPPRAWMSAQKL